MYLSIIGVYSFILILSVSCSSYFVAYNLFDEACQATLSQDFSNGTVLVLEYLSDVILSWDITYHPKYCTQLTDSREQKNIHGPFSTLLIPQITYPKFENY